jgi:succinate dehydrogenase/fumarate reductase flavoprotein subunit
MMQVKTSDILVIGAGGAGLTAALEASQSEQKIILTSKTALTRAQSVMAQGGINASLGNVCEDNVTAHIEDTIKGAAGLANEDAAKVLCDGAHDAIAWLDSKGVPFSRTEEGAIAQRAFGGTSKKRTCYSSDMTGHAIVHALADQIIAKDNIEICSEYFLLRLLKKENRIIGAQFLEIASGDEVAIFSPSVILATGGYGAIFIDHTTNSPATTGDGIVAAYDIGAALQDMEFLQFHPTTLEKNSILMSEAARGAGGYLINEAGERFVDELSTRDEVTKAIYSERKSGKKVYLDLRHIDLEVLKHDLKEEVNLCQIYLGIDPAHELIPIKPSAHYSMGGVAINTKSEVLDANADIIPGLYACGECACHGGHGANRLGGNSLLDIVVFGRIAAQQTILNSKKTQVEQTETESLLSEYRQEGENENFYQLKKRFKEEFHHLAGVYKTSENLTKAKQLISLLLDNVIMQKPNDKSLSCNSSLCDYFEFINSLKIAKIYVDMAQQRDESRGAHNRIDYPEKDENQINHSLIYRK